MDAGLFLLAVAVPLAFFPLSSAPFADAKLVLLTLGTLLLWVSGVPVDRRLALPAGVWIAVVVAAALTGVDPRMSIIGAADHGTGLIMLAACGSLVVLGPNIPPDAVSRMRGWLVGAGLVVAAVAVGFRVAPDAFDRVVSDLSFRGSTAGNPVFAAAFLAACIPAALGSKGDTRRRLVPILAVLALGFAANGQRSSLVLPFVALAACLWPMRAVRARVLLAGATLAVVVSTWILLVAPFLPSASHEVSETARQFDTLTGERQRLAVYTADLRGFTRRPVLGWGPTNTWSAFLSSATPEEIDTAGRGWAEAHNILLESLVTTGLAGTAAFVWLVLRIAPRMARPPSGAGWAAGGALTVAVFHLYEPLSLTVTPLMFLLAGVSARAPAATPEPAAAPERALVLGKAGRASALARAGVGAALAAMLLVSSLALGASALEQWGRTHYGEWSLRASLRLQPWRLSATELLARNLAVDGYTGDEAAAAESRSVIGAAVRQHPWNPHVRLSALDVELLLRNLPGAQGWVRRHLERFPSDPVAIPTSLPA